jgi:hypothetical protein
MSIDEHDKQTGLETGTGGNQESGKTGQSPQPGAKEEPTRTGTKADIRGTDAPKGGAEQPPPDKMRDGT